MGKSSNVATVAIPGGFEAGEATTISNREFNQDAAGETN
jgi:hypothetical protein